jgi:hypothetical protein
MAASDYVPIFFKNRLHLAGRPQMSTRPSSKAGWEDIRSLARHNFRKLRRQRHRRQQRRRLPPLHGVRPRHGKHRHDKQRRDKRRRDKRQRGQHQRAHRDMRTHQLKS